MPCHHHCCHDLLTDLHRAAVLQVRSKKDYTPFPPPQQPSKVDLQLESGEYFLRKEIKEAQAAAARRDAQVEKSAAKKRQRAAAFDAPQVRFCSFSET